ncbi:Cyclin-L1-1 [Raphanus sativus]|uniref:Cyclin-L1-1 n=1 Tax=Raphanus sativus TaxID=3726 RepID=A0A6J0MZG5_RAPSA|nr:cyclin-L1-1 [Raphanus sativus]KAJ4894674.1 Cyclin-L1-1 [Raphanus sativus]
MIYTAIDNFYLPEEQIKNSPSRKDGIDETTETTLRIYGCDLIQEAGILLRLPQAVMATGQVLFHRFYCKKSLAKFDVKIVAASCVWLASKLEENPKKARQVIIVFHRMECRRENLPIEHLDLFSKKYSELKVELSRTERHILKEMGFVCHVEHPHKFISNYLATLETPPELRQEAWNLANDSLRTTLCVRFRSEVVACGVVYAAARRFQVPLPENPPWWKAFDADKSGIGQVCRVLAHLYSLPKAQYISVCKDGKPFTFSSRSASSQAQSATKDISPAVGDAVDTKGTCGSANNDSRDGKTTTPHEMATDAKKSDTESNSLPIVGDSREDRRKGGESDRENERGRERDRVSRSHRDRGRDSDKESDRDRDKLKEHSHHRSRDRLKDSSDRSRHHSSRDRDYRESSHSSKDRRSRHH